MTTVVLKGLSFLAPWADNIIRTIDTKKLPTAAHRESATVSTMRASRNAMEFTGINLNARCGHIRP
ncbi:hypothetical protein NUITMVR1_57160 (plasmid) [Raoultella ornithinolytica]|nr:hypothetical protein NUITMVR1_57160 [Raoultella ornithinolytica]